jgi:hypothetical protein
MLQELTSARENTSIVRDHHKAMTILIAKGCAPIVDVLTELLAGGAAVVSWNSETGQTVLYTHFDEGESWFEVTDDGLRCIHRH